MSSQSQRASAARGASARFANAIKVKRTGAPDPTPKQVAARTEWRKRLQILLDAK